MKLSSFIAKLSFLSAFITLLLFCWNYFVPEKYSLKQGFYAVLYFFISTALFHRMTLKANEKSPQHFVRTFIGTTAIRMFLGLIIIVIYALLYKATAMGFALLFLLLYFIYLIFEVLLLLTFLRSSSSTSSGNE